MLHLGASCSNQLLTCEGYGDFSAALEGNGMYVQDVMCIVCHTAADHFQLLFPIAAVTLGCDSMIAGQ